MAGGGKAHQGSNSDCEDDSLPLMDGIGEEARFNYPWGIEFDPTDDVLYVADCVSRFNFAELISFSTQQIRCEKPHKCLFEGE